MTKVGILTATANYIFIFNVWDFLLVSLLPSNVIPTVPIYLLPHPPGKNERRDDDAGAWGGGWIKKKNKKRFEQ